MKPLIFHPDAEDEFRAAIEYYNQQYEGLGDAFRDEVRQAVDQIARMPGTFTPHGSEGLRKNLVRRFPYAVFYLELNDTIWIAAVAHHRRRPNYWKRRSPQQ